MKEIEYNLGIEPTDLWFCIMYKPKDCVYHASYNGDFHRIYFCGNTKDIETWIRLMSHEFLHAIFYKEFCILDSEIQENLVKILGY